MIIDKNTELALECYRKGLELALIPQLRLGFMQQLAWAHYLREEWCANRWTARCASG